jgi:membrane-associated PAP2 superfamily phosphatase
MMMMMIIIMIIIIMIIMGHSVAQLVAALCYRPEGRGFESG